MYFLWSFYDLSCSSFSHLWCRLSCHNFDVSRAYYVSPGNANFTLVIRGSALSFILALDEIHRLRFHRNGEQTCYESNSQELLFCLKLTSFSKPVTEIRRSLIRKLTSATPLECPPSNVHEKIPKYS